MIAATAFHFMLFQLWPTQTVEGPAEQQGGETGTDMLLRPGQPVDEQKEHSPGLIDEAIEVGIHRRPQLIRNRGDRHIGHLEGGGKGRMKDSTKCRYCSSEPLFS